ncbi:copper ABC transporter ATP-binding protein [Chitinophaga parva]|uniref:Copper ABC transporter ATP-binding protein n=1 Tax=Chitinophaga parva TaxID=2169414 RepID=A0A2T7BE76_9BACT|nr:ABC transporter ATP-binding protein [Chitinophaga parva]PUZ23406.1 copper ABC transporter ATP-binding protein [Chitinophaga parva]
MIEIAHLTKSFRKFKALDDISLEFREGQTISLLGPNGSGKTTLIKSILGLVTPDTGVIRINGEETKTRWEYRSRIGYMPQIGRYPENMTIGQVLQMLKDIRKDCKVYDEELVRDFDLQAVKNKMMRSLSGGTRQKVSACLAFLFSPDILILDEPTAGLDPVASELLKAKISRERAMGKLILITSHVLSDLDDITSHIVYLQEGKLVCYKTVDELKESTGEEKLNKVMAAIMQRNVTQRIPVL